MNMLEISEVSVVEGSVNTGADSGRIRVIKLARPPVDALNRDLIRGLEHEYSGDTLRLRFALSAGSFATTVLREIIAGAATGE